MDNIYLGTVTYTVKDGVTTLGSYAINQKVAGVDFQDGGMWWDYLGDTHNVQSGTLVIELPDIVSGSNYVVADAVRIE